MSADQPTRPCIIITAVLDASARPAAVTRCHGEAYEKALRAAEGQAIANLELIELPINTAAHAALRKHAGLADDQAAVYDLFPLSASIPADVRTAAAQFLAAESLWTLDAQGVFGPGVLSVKLDLPARWDRDPKAVHQKLVESGALELSESAVETFRAIKQAWQAS